MIRRFLRPAEVDAAFGRLRENWSDLLGALQISTPNEHADRMINIWNPYQCMATFNLSRSASLFETGLGRGMGFRDSNQDLLGFVHMVPDRARQRILDIAATQLPSGGAYHQYQPLTKRGNDAIGSGFNDDPLWLILAVAAYLKETGDRGILDEQVPFDNEPGSESTLYEHLQRSVLHARPARSARAPVDRAGRLERLPQPQLLLGHPGRVVPDHREPGRWRRRVGLHRRSLHPGRGRAGADRTAPRAPGDAEHYRPARDEMAAAVHDHGWDGAVVPPRLRLLRGRGGLGGQRRRPDLHRTAGNVRHGRDRERRRTGPARPRLRRDTAGDRHGVMLVQPAYTSYHLELGEISSYPPGYKENGSVFCHTNPWIMIAETRVGSGDRAFDYYLRINPSARES